jgi:hypothetical protein
MKLLCIGGICDGQRIEVPDRQTVVLREAENSLYLGEWSEPPNGEALKKTIKVQTYVRRVLRGDCFTFVVLVPFEFTGDDIIKTMLDGYRKPAK